MKLGIEKGEISKLRDATVIVCLTQEFSWKHEILVFLNDASQGWVRTFVEQNNFKGKDGEALVIPASHFSSLRTIVLYGIGEKKIKTLERIRKTGGGIVKKAHILSLEKIVVSLPWVALDEYRASEVAHAFSEGALLAMYQFTHYKKESDPVTLQEIKLLDERGKEKLLKEGIELGEIFSQGALYARDLVNEPASHMKPHVLAQEAIIIGKENKNISVKTYTGKELEKIGAGALIAVGKGSSEPPYLIHLHYMSKGEKSKAKVCLVGKGVTFDSGGLSLKPENHMETMKMDMAGAAVVLGVFKSLLQLTPHIEIHGIIPTCENMPSGNALRPGDVVTALNGTTVEVLNTDAEGRLILADALSYAVKHIQPTHIIDLATLTGAVMGALGEDVAGLFSTNEKLTSRLKDASEYEGEKLWELPLVDEYRDQLKSDIADMKNITGTRYGGAITAALFLEAFVEKIPWAHIDIAGTAWNSTGTPSYMSKGATGAGVRLLLQTLRKW